MVAAIWLIILRMAETFERFSSGTYTTQYTQYNTAATHPAANNITLHCQAGQSWH
eukprot:COSAG06_NODE_1230_length_10161_cov_2.903498_9_plen_55_part_00